MRLKQGEGGITLIEVAVVMAIVGIMALFLAPAIGGWMDNYRIRQTARDISSTLQLAKMKAVSSRLQYRIVFDVGNETYQLEKNDGGWVTEGNVNKVPRGVDIDNTDFTSDTVQFNPNSTSSNGTITIVNEKGKQYIYRELNALQINYVPSEANFVYVTFKEDISVQLYNALLEKGVIIRPAGPREVRMTIGLPGENRKLIKALKSCITEVRN